MKFKKFAALLTAAVLVGTCLGGSAAAQVDDGGPAVPDSVETGEMPQPEGEEIGKTEEGGREGLSEKEVIKDSADERQRETPGDTETEVQVIDLEADTNDSKETNKTDKESIGESEDWDLADDQTRSYELIQTLLLVKGSRFDPKSFFGDFPYDPLKEEIRMISCEPAFRADQAGIYEIRYEVTKKVQGKDTESTQNDAGTSSSAGNARLLLRKVQVLPGGISGSSSLGTASRAAGSSSILSGTVLDAAVDFLGYVTSGQSLIPCFTVNSAPAFCLDFEKYAPADNNEISGTVYSVEDDSYNPGLAAALYYGMNGPGALVESGEEGVIATTLACDYAMNGENSHVLEVLPESYWKIRDRVDAKDAPEDTRYILWGTGYEAYQRIGQLTTPLPNNRGKIKINKVNLEDNAPLEDAKFSLYTDPQCKNLIYKFPGTDTKGETITPMFELTHETYYIRETAPPADFLISKKIYEISPNINETTSITIPNTPIKAEVTVTKKDKDSDTSVPQGDASLENAEYGLYAGQDIYAPGFSVNIIHQKDELVCIGSTDLNGTIKFSDLYPGYYYLMEHTAPKGYRVNPEKYAVRCTTKDNTNPTIHVELTVHDSVISRPFRLLKISSRYTGADPLPLQAGFQVYLVRDLTAVKDGSLLPSSGREYQASDFISYDFSKERPASYYDSEGTRRQAAELFSQEDGFLTSPSLPYGTYVVVETIVPKGHTPLAPFLVKIDEDGEEPVELGWIENQFEEAFIKVVKKDKETGNVVLKKGAQFLIRDSESDALIEFASSDENAAPLGSPENPFTTDKNGTFRTPEPLPGGTYRVEEITPPPGYELAAEEDFPIVSMKENIIVELEEETKVPIITAEIYNAPQKGRVRIEKLGEYLSEAAVYEDRNADFLYEYASVAKCSFELCAAENIYSSDGQKTILWKKDEKIEVLTTSSDGTAVSQQLPCGSYRLKEITAGDGMVLNSEFTDFKIEADSNKSGALPDTALTIHNKRQQSVVEARKLDGETKNPLAGAVFAICTQEPLLNQNGEQILPKDTVLATASSQEDGSIPLPLSLPQGSYYLSELTAPNGYEKLAENIPIQISYDAKEQEEEVITYKLEVENQPLKNSQPLPATGDSSTLLPYLGLLASIILLLLLIKFRHTAKA